MRLANHLISFKVYKLTSWGCTIFPKYYISILLAKQILASVIATFGLLDYLGSDIPKAAGARRRVGCRICHYLSWTDSNKPSLLFSNFVYCVSKGSLFRLFSYRQSETQSKIYLLFIHRMSNIINRNSIACHYNWTSRKTTSCLPEILLLLITNMFSRLRNKTLKPRLHDTTLLYISWKMYHDISCSPTKTLYIQLFGVASNSILNRACPIPYSLKDTTFYLFLSLANENVSHRFMNLQMFICLFDLRKIDRLNII